MTSSYTQNITKKGLAFFRDFCWVELYCGPSQPVEHETKRNVPESQVFPKEASGKNK